MNPGHLTVHMPFIDLYGIAMLISLVPILWVSGMRRTAQTVAALLIAWFVVQHVWIGELHISWLIVPVMAVLYVLDTGLDWLESVL